MPLPPATFILDTLVVAAAYVVFGMTGFGSTIIVVPLHVVSGGSLIVRA